MIADGLSLPILWTMLDKRGNSNQDERKVLINRYIRLFGLQTVGCIIADREFIGQEWVAYLSTHPIKFYIRIRENLTVIHRGRALKAFWLFHNLSLQQIRHLEKPLLLNGQWVVSDGFKNYQHQRFFGVCHCGYLPIRSANHADIRKKMDHRMLSVRRCDSKQLKRLVFISKILI